MNDLVITPLGTVSPYAKDDKNCPGFLIEYKNNKYLLDCGNGITRLLNFPDDLINLKIFISHLHPDHFGDLTSIAHSLLVYKNLGYISDNVDIYIPKSNIGGYAYCNYDLFRNTNIKPSIEYEYIKKFEETCPINIIGYNNINYKNDDLTIKSLLVPHQISTYAFRINTDEGSIVYSADTGTNNKLREFAKDCDLFICESTFLKGQTRLSDNHLYAYEAAMIARDANVNKLLLTHFWPELDKNLYLKEAKEIFENTSVAEEGKRLVLRRG